MAASAAFILSPATHLAFITYYNQLQLMSNGIRDSRRIRYEEIDKLYARTTDHTAEHHDAKAANKAGDSTRHQNITVPVVMPQVESAVVYQASVFLTGVPIFGVVASPEFMDEALQLESAIDDQATRGGWTQELLTFFKDGFKYNSAVVEVTWESEVTTNLETDAAFSSTEGKPKEVIWSGNVLRRIDPYNSFADPRVLPTEVYKKGEFAGYTDFISRIELKRFVSTLPDTQVFNLTKAYESASLGSPNNASNANYFVPTINPEINPDDVYKGSTNWMSWAGISERAGKTIQYKDTYEKTVIYVKILPSEFSLKVPKANTPQIWKLIIINHSIIIYAERQTNAHGYIPMFFGQPNYDGLGHQTKTLAENGADFQHLSSALMNSIIASRRRAISDRTLYDPSRITSAAINAENPSAKIPVRPSAYGKNVSESVYQFPYREDQASFAMSQVRDLLAMANSLNGQNPAKQGQFVKGNKTLKEFDSVMNNANGRDQMVAILLESQVFVPIKEVLKINILQFQGGTTIYNREKERAIEIDPLKLRKAVLSFKVSDGLTPNDKLIGGEALAASLQVLGSSPQISSSYNIGELFSYLMKTQGAKITPFEKSKEQIAYEQAMASWQNLMMTAIDKGLDIKKLPPQPLPKDYGYLQDGGSADTPRDTGSDSTASTTGHTEQ